MTLYLVYKSIVLVKWVWVMLNYYTVNKAAVCATAQYCAPILCMKWMLKCSLNISCICVLIFLRMYHIKTHVPLIPVQVVAWLRQPNIMDILCERHSGLRTSPALRDKVTAIRMDGTAALDRLSHDVDLIIVLRLLNYFVSFHIYLLLPSCLTYM